MAQPQSKAGKLWAPHPGPQTEFLASDADEALFGGAAGGGKSDCLLLGAMFFLDEPTYRALLLRRTFPELSANLIERSQVYYPALGGRYNDQKHQWSFPSGAKIRFSSIEHEKDRLKFKSDEYQFVGYDELSSFTEKQYIYLFSRLRSSVGLPCVMRAATNPGGPGHDWVLRRFAPWLYQPGRSEEYSGPYAAPGQVLHFKRERDVDSVVLPGTPGAMSRVFFPATIADNPTILVNDPQYKHRLEMLDALTRAQLLGGDWMARSAPGIMFNRDWFTVVDRGPERLAVVRVRYWDRAATEGERRASASGGPAWTAGVLMSKDVDGRCFVEDVVRFRGAPHEVERRIRATAERDRERWGHVTTCLEQDPGQAGKFEVHHYISHTLSEHEVRAVLPHGDKVTRAKPVSAQSEHGNVLLLRGTWNEVFLRELEQFPMGQKDQVDAFSGAYTRVAGVMTREVAHTGGRREYAGAKGGGY